MIGLTSVAGGGEGAADTHREGGLHLGSVLRVRAALGDLFPGSFENNQREVILFSPRKEIP